MRTDDCEKNVINSIKGNPDHQPRTSSLSVQLGPVWFCSGFGNLAWKWTDHLVVWDPPLVQCTMGVRHNLSKTILSSAAEQLHCLVNDFLQLRAPTWEYFQLLDYNNYGLLSKKEKTISFAEPKKKFNSKIHNVCNFVDRWRLLGPKKTFDQVTAGPNVNLNHRESRRILEHPQFSSFLFIAMTAQITGWDWTFAPLGSRTLRRC